MGRPKKIKIKLVENKIKKIEVIRKSESLEEELNEESDKKFEEFMATGEMRAPVLEAGQQPDQQISASQIEVAAQERQTSAQRQAGAGVQINPEFSVYELARTVGRAETTRSRQVYEAARSGGDVVMRRNVEAGRIDETATMIDRKRGFVNPELEALNAGNQRSEYYGVKVEKSEMKRGRGPAWEGQ